MMAQPHHQQPPASKQQQPTTIIHHYRGIANVNGTSCHTSSALQLLFHCFPKLRTAVLELALASAEIYAAAAFGGGGGRCSDKNEKATNKKEGGEEEDDDDDDDNAIIRKELVYQLAWFFHLLAYSENVLELYGEEDEHDDDGGDDDDECRPAEESAAAALANDGDSDTALPAVTNSATISEDEDFDPSSELRSYLAVDTVCRESALAAGAEEYERRRKQQRQKQRQQQSSTRSRKKKKSSSRHNAGSGRKSSSSSSRHHHHRLGSSSSSREEDSDDGGEIYEDGNELLNTPPRISRHAASSSGSTHRGEEETDDASDGSAAGSRHASGSSRRHHGATRHNSSSKNKKKKKSKLLKPREMNPAQRRAIEAFMSKARSGAAADNAANNRDWEALVRVMKEGDRRERYGVALGMALRKKGPEDSAEDGRSGGGSEDLTRESVVGGDETGDGNNKANNDTTVGNPGGTGGPSNNDAAATTTTNNTTTATNASNNNNNATNGPIDPSSFYAHLTTYTSALDQSSYINTNNVGDAAMVFRCLISALEFSVKNELARLERELSISEIESWNNEECRDGDDDDAGAALNANTDTMNNHHRFTVERKTTPRHRLKASLEEVRSALRRSFHGSLVSRIVGASSSAHLTYTAKFENRGGEIVTIPTAITTTTTVRRTKRKGGNLERPIPVPFPLPVVQQGNLSSCGAATKASGRNNNKGSNKGKNNLAAATANERQYFPSLSQSLQSITIEPNPIRGYDWRALMKRDPDGVVEEKFVTKVDQDGNEIVDEKKDKVRGEALEAGDRFLKDLEEEEKKKKEEEEEGRGNDVFAENGNFAAHDVSKAARMVRKDSEEEVEFVNNNIKEGTEIGIGDNDMNEQSIEPTGMDNFGNIEAGQEVNQEFTIIAATSSYRIVACQTDFGYEMGTQTMFDEDGNVVHAPNAKTIEVRTSIVEKEEEKVEMSEAKSKEKEKDEAKDNEEESKDDEDEEGSVSNNNRMSSKVAMDKDAAYAAAVSALVSTPNRFTSYANRMRSKPIDNCGGPLERDRRGRDRGAASTKGMSVESIRGRRTGDTSADSGTGRATRGSSVEPARNRRARESSVDSRRSTGRLRANANVSSGVADHKHTSYLKGDDPFTPTDDSGNNGGGTTVVSYGKSPNIWGSLPGFTTPSGMEVGPSPNTPELDEVKLAYAPEGTSGSLLKLPNDGSSEDSSSSSSNDESSVDSQVSSVDNSSSEEEEGENSNVANSKQVVDAATNRNNVVIGRGVTDDTSFSTNSSAIETPPNIDDFSLGSFTDDSVLDEEEEKKESDPITVTRINDVDSDVTPEEEVANKIAFHLSEEEEVKAANYEDAGPLSNPFAVPEEEKKDSNLFTLGIREVAPSPGDSASLSAVSDSNDDEDSSSSSSSDDDDDSSTSSSSSESSSSSSSSSSTDSSSSEESSSDDSSSSSDEDEQINAILNSSNAGNADEKQYSTKYSQNHHHNQRKSPTEEWITRKETRLCHPLPHSLIFHLKRFEYSPKTGRVEKLPGVMDVPEELDMKAYCLESGADVKDDICYRYILSGAIVHVDPIEKEDEVAYGEASEGHYVAFVASGGTLEGTTSTAARNNSDAWDLPPDSKEKDDVKNPEVDSWDLPQDKKKEGSSVVWTELDDENVRTVEDAKETLSGCEVTNDVEKISQKVESSSAASAIADATESQQPDVLNSTSDSDSSDQLDDEFLQFIGAKPKKEEADAVSSDQKKKPPADTTEDSSTKRRTRRVVKEKERRYATLVVYSRACECT